MPVRPGRLTSQPRTLLPVVTLKAAVTLDGRIAGRGGDSKWITGELARRESHRLRAQHDAVMVGIGTVRADDPELTVRHVKGRDPIRVVLDSNLRTPLKAKLLHHDSKAPTWIVHALDARSKRLGNLPGVELIGVKRGRDRRLSLRAVLQALAKRGVNTLLVEGGGQLHGALLDAGLVDRAAVFVAPLILGDARAIPLAAGRGQSRISDGYRLRDPKIKRLGDDVLFTGALLKGGT
jgi:diaminohydroxyphosphoribosylaminopyrimidine deaminase/5-amino-6-(5-phosphoribosylamino)uracil reductase